LDTTLSTLRASTYLNKITLQPHSIKLDAIVLHIDVQVSIASADGAIAFHHPAVHIVERGRESDGVAHGLAVAGCGVLLVIVSFMIPSALKEGGRTDG
jgi:hypothetical protein